MITKIITYNAMSENIRKEIDAELIRKIFEIVGGNPDEFHEFQEFLKDDDDVYNIELEARFVARSITEGKIISVGKNWKDLQIEYKIKIDETKKSTYEERFETAYYELIAEQV